MKQPNNIFKCQVIARKWGKNSEQIMKLCVKLSKKLYQVPEE